MGLLEQKSLTRRRIGSLQKGILSLVAMSGLLLVAATAPNTLKLLKQVPGLKKHRAWADTRTTLSRLARSGYVVFVEKQGKRYARITPQGKKILQIEKEKSLLAKRDKKRWDKRWRIVIFDVPEKVRRLRNQLRYEMRAAGFVQLQGSVWVHAYDCEDFVALLKTDLALGKRVVYIIADTIENDTTLRGQFGV